MQNHPSSKLFKFSPPALAWMALALMACRPATAPSKPRFEAPEVRREIRDEPTLPPMLTITADPADPEKFTVRLDPAMEGEAHLSVRTDRPVQWTSPNAAAPMTLRRAGGERTFQLHVPAVPSKSFAEASAPGIVPSNAPGVMVDLTLTDPQGNVLMSVSREVPVPAVKALPSPPAASMRDGVSADGQRVRASVPAGAPQPRVGGSNP